ncbi:unnamed protein product [Dovyalis caffra]|uniref:RIN4 pathogenic type III effector avirulence factor Avr cleavage site domain-containing protein n=1 Tax=Dovyalis caffra TaxID=77055 RepID=A0AAV1R594_9ROSI|nr:unnamed protein product [Dovyalis caffra]
MSSDDLVVGEYVSTELDRSDDLGIDEPAKWKFNKTQDQGRPLPKFGEWDVNNPASAEGFTVIFSKARDEKKSGAGAGAGSASQRKTNSSQANSQKKDFAVSETNDGFGGLSDYANLSMKFFKFAFQVESGE